MIVFLVGIQLQFTDPDCFDLVERSTTVDTTERIVLTTTTTTDNKYFYII